MRYMYRGVARIIAKPSWGAKPLKEPSKSPARSAGQGNSPDQASERHLTGEPCLSGGGGSKLRGSRGKRGQQRRGPYTCKARKGTRNFGDEANAKGKAVSGRA